jgi:hypothetical protein
VDDFRVPFDLREAEACASARSIGGVPRSCNMRCDFNQAASEILLPLAIARHPEIAHRLCAINISIDIDFYFMPSAFVLVFGTSCFVQGGTRDGFRRETR